MLLGWCYWYCFCLPFALICLGFVTLPHTLPQHTPHPLPFPSSAGLELLADLALADYLLASRLAECVVLHGKALPWFVSDALSADVDGLLTAAAEAGTPALSAAALRWREYLDQGRWVWRADAFWTTPHPYAWMPQASSLIDDCKRMLCQTGMYV